MLLFELTTTVVFLPIIGQQFSRGDKLFHKSLTRMFCDTSRSTYTVKLITAQYPNLSKRRTQISRMFCDF